MVTALSEAPELEDAFRACADALEAQLDGVAPDLVLAFPSREHVIDYGRIPALARARFRSALLAGCSAGGVIGGGRAIEGATSLALAGFVLPNVELLPFRVPPGSLPSLDDSPRAWKSLVGLHETPERLHFLLFADPFTCPADVLLRGLDYAYPAAPKLGGLASAASSPGANTLYLDDETFVAGAVGVALWGALRLDPVVAQGGIPIGRALRITKCDRNILFELDGRPALEVFQEIVEAMDDPPSPERPGTFLLGIQADGLGAEPRAGDFLVRNILGVDPNAGAIGVAERLNEGATVQFHVLGPETAALELRELLARSQAEERTPPAGAILFACNGRGAHLYGRSEHDPDLFGDVVGARVPLAGFFCAGEIGPIGAQTYLHGMTSSFGILRPTRDARTAAPAAEAAAARRIPIRGDAAGGSRDDG